MDKPWKEDATKLILSITNRKIGNITKRFPKLDIDQLFVKRQLQDQSKLLNDGKKISVIITFYYQYIESNKSSRGGAIANQKVDLKAKTSGLNQGIYIRKAYLLIYYSSRLYIKGDCYQQNKGKHYYLLLHYIRMLTDYLQAGRPLNKYNNILKKFC